MDPIESYGLSRKTKNPVLQEDVTTDGVDYFSSKIVFFLYTSSMYL